MFTPHEIFARMPASSTEQLFTFLHDQEKRLYKATIETLAKQRKLRGVFIERKPRVERHAWMRDALGKKVNEDVAAQLLQIWLVSAHSGMLCDFLDHLGIPHDDNGTISEVPAAPTREKLEAATTALLEKHDPAVVTVYLHAFQALDDAGGWPTLDALLAEDARLKL
jgi:hypothetical protein